MAFGVRRLFAIGLIFVCPMGGSAGIILAGAAIDVHLHDTYFVVAHFHYVLVAGSLFALLGGTYFWLPKWAGHM